VIDGTWTPNKEDKNNKLEPGIPPPTIGIENTSNLFSFAKYFLNNYYHCQSTRL